MNSAYVQSMYICCIPTSPCVLSITSTSLTKNTFPVFLEYTVVKQNACCQILGKTTKWIQKLLCRKQNTTALRFSFGVVPTTMNFCSTQIQETELWGETEETSKATHHLERPRWAWFNVIVFRTNWVMLRNPNLMSMMFQGSIIVQPVPYGLALFWNCQWLNTLASSPTALWNSQTEESI